MSAPAEARAPGKLMFAGEYSVLRPGGVALAAAVDAPLTVRVVEADRDRVSSEALGLARAEPSDDPRLGFVAAALAAARQVAPVPPLSVDVSGTAGQIDGRGSKLGFGSSASVTVATVAAALTAAGHELDLGALYRLAALAHARAQGRAGSAYDVATQVWGGVVVYRPPLPHRWGVPTTGSLAEWLAEPWPELEAHRLPWPEGLFLSACWVGRGASTRGMMARAAVGATDAADRLEAMRLRAKDVIRGWELGSVVQILRALDAAEDAFRAWDRVTGTGAVTPEVRRAVDIARAAGLAGRTSGAGGGDCVLAFASDAGSLGAAHAAWRAEGLHPVDIALDDSGATWSLSA